jgi:hypothetical protein
MIPAATRRFMPWASTRHNPYCRANRDILQDRQRPTVPENPRALSHQFLDPIP